MNILTRTKNNCIYAYHRKRRDKALRMMEKYQNEGGEKWKKWARKGIESLKRCDEIPLH